MIVGLDARGFIFAPALALRLNIRFVPIRKRGKLPGDCVQAKYVKEYGEDVFEMQKGRLTSDDRVVVVDDLIATGRNPYADVTPLQSAEHLCDIFPSIWIALWITVPSHLNPAHLTILKSLLLSITSVSCLFFLFIH